MTHRTNLVLTMVVILVGTFSVSLQTANAAPVTFFGEDENNGNLALSHPVASAAQTLFFSNLSNIGTENFDSFPVNATNISPNFGNGVTASLSGGVIRNMAVNGQFAISSPNFYDTETTSFSISLSQPIAAFGFYATDVGDYGGLLSLTLTDKNGNISTLAVPADSDVNGDGTGPANGSALYFGFYDLDDTYTSITFNNSNTADTFGFDDFSVGTAAQVAPVGVPEPITLSIFGAGLAGAAAVRRRRKPAKQH